MFLLPAIVVGLAFALALGGRPSRLLDVELRHSWAVVVAFALQLVLFPPIALDLSNPLVDVLHLASYALLLLFGVANIRNLALLPLFAGMSLNALAITVNGGRMPASQDALASARVGIDGRSNVALHDKHLSFLGDVFALPRNFPLANVFSVGDLLIGIGIVTLIVAASTAEGSARALVPGRLIRPLKVDQFRRLAAAKLVSHLGDWLTLAALIGWVYKESHSTAAVALLLGVRLAPPILGGGIAAAVVDRLRKERLLVWIELLRGVVIVGAIAGVVANDRPLVFGAVAVSGALAAISAATVPALVPSLLDKELLPAANASLGIAQDVAMGVGALAAGIALSSSGAVLALLIDLGTFVVAAFLYTTIRVRPAAQALDQSDTGLRAGFRYLVGRKALLVVVCAFAAATLATGLTNATLPRFLDGELHMGVGAYGYGLSALAWGLAAGQAVVGFARVGQSAGRWIGAALIAMAILFVTLAETTHAPTALLVLALIGFVDGTTDVLFDTIVQREADPRYYGRVFGFASAFITTTMMTAVAASPLFNHVATPRAVILFAGLFLLAAAGVALVGSRRPAGAAALPARVGSQS
jgi:hypothetical protein